MLEVFKSTEEFTSLWTILKVKRVGIQKAKQEKVKKISHRGRASLNLLTVIIKQYMAQIKLIFS